MPRIILPPDAFDELPDGWCHSTEPDDADRTEHELPEYDDYADRVAAERRYDAEERFACLLWTAEERRGAA